MRNSQAMDGHWIWADGIALPAKSPSYSYKETEVYNQLLKISLLECDMFEHFDELVYRLFTSPATNAWNAQKKEIYKKTMAADIMSAAQFFLRVCNPLFKDMLRN